jgi:hypothetical protein
VPQHKTDGTEIHDERGKHEKNTKECMQDSGENDPGTEQQKQRGRPGRENPQKNINGQ